jgi:hypothetical protein
MSGYSIGTLGDVKISSSSGAIQLNSAVHFNDASNANLEQFSGLSLTSGKLVGSDGSALVAVDSSAFASASDLSALQTTVSGISASSGVLTASYPLAVDGSANIALNYANPLTVVDNNLAVKLDSSLSVNGDGQLSVNFSGYSDSSTIASTYLSQSDASSTYLSQSDASSTYLAQSDASSTYALQSNVMPVHPQVIEILPSAHRDGSVTATPANSNTKTYTLGFITDTVTNHYSIELAHFDLPDNTTVALESVIYYNLTDSSNVNTKGYIKYDCMFDSALITQQDPDSINNDPFYNKIIPSENISYVPNNSAAAGIASRVVPQGYTGGENLRFNNYLDGSNPRYTGQIYVKNTISSFGKSA